MIKLGADSVEMREMSNDDIFSSRLKLLIIMIKAYLKDCPLGNYRKQAIIENANQFSAILFNWSVNLLP